MKSKKNSFKKIWSNPSTGLGQCFWNQTLGKGRWGKFRVEKLSKLNLCYNMILYELTQSPENKFLGVCFIFTFELAFPLMCMNSKKVNLYLWFLDFNLTGVEEKWGNQVFLLHERHSVD